MEHRNVLTGERQQFMDPQPFPWVLTADGLERHEFLFNHPLGRTARLIEHGRRQLDEILSISLPPSAAMTPQQRYPHWVNDQDGYRRQQDNEGAIETAASLIADVFSSSDSSSSDSFSGGGGDFGGGGSDTSY
jgi:hypothetical protein